MAKATKTRYCYAFEEGDGTNKKLLGGKGAGLCTMTRLACRYLRGSASPLKLTLDIWKAAISFRKASWMKSMNTWRPWRKRPAKASATPANPY